MHSFHFAIDLSLKILNEEDDAGVLTILYKRILKEIFHTKLKVLSALHPVSCTSSFLLLNYVFCLSILNNTFAKIKLIYMKKFLDSFILNIKHNQSI